MVPPERLTASTELGPIADQELAQRSGMERRLRQDRAAAIPVLDLEEESATAAAKVRAEIVRAIEETALRPSSSAAPAWRDLAASLSQRTGIPVIGGYAGPLPKPFAGDLARHAFAVPDQDSSLATRQSAYERLGS